MEDRGWPGANSYRATTLVGRIDSFLARTIIGQCGCHIKDASDHRLYLHRADHHDLNGFSDANPIATISPETINEAAMKKKTPPFIKRWWPSLSRPCCLDAADTGGL
jgi:hypothetical protein